MEILKRRGSWLEGVHNDLAKGSDKIKLHQDQVAMFQKLGAVDKETARKAIFGQPFSNGKCIADWTLEEASIINDMYPEIFLDATGKAMEKFLKTPEGKRYAL